MRNLSKLTISALVIVLIAGCGTSPEEARQKLADLNIEYTKESFAEHAGRGDMQAVELFLKAGMDPDHAMPAAVVNDRDQIVQTLEDAGAQRIIPQARPFITMLYALKENDISQFQTAFSEGQKREFGFQRPGVAKKIFLNAKRGFGGRMLEIVNYKFRYDGSSRRGDLGVTYPTGESEKQNVVNENGKWVLDERP